MNRLPQLISNVFHPLLAMPWATILLIYFSPMLALPAYSRWLMVGEVFLYSTILPSVLILFLAKIGVVRHGFALRDRRDRIIPLLLQVILYAIQAYVLHRQGIPGWGLSFYVCGLSVAFLFMIVTCWWKISGHAAANASLATGALLMYYHFPSIVPLWLPLLLIVVTGGVCSIRVYLGRHTLAQVAVGALAGCLCMFWA